MRCDPSSLANIRYFFCEIFICTKYNLRVRPNNGGQSHSCLNTQLCINPFKRERIANIDSTIEPISLLYSPLYSFIARNCKRTNQMEAYTVSHKCIRNNWKNGCCRTKNQLIDDAISADVEVASLRVAHFESQTYNRIVRFHAFPVIVDRETIDQKRSNKIEQ